MLQRKPVSTLEEMTGLLPVQINHFDESSGVGKYAASSRFSAHEIASEAFEASIAEKFKLDAGLYVFRVFDGAAKCIATWHVKFVE